MEKTFCGAIALLGRPNAGKSTLLNALLGQKVAGVSKKPQTTRNSILGIVTEDKYQLLILDTPGIHRTGGLARMNQIMVREAFRALDEVSAVAYLFDLNEGLTTQDLLFLKRIRAATPAPIRLFLSQIDKKPKAVAVEAYQKALALLETHPEQSAEIHMISAKRPESLAEFKKIMFSTLPEAPFRYEKDALTDRSTRFVVTELIRECLFRNLGQELPYHCAVTIDEFEEAPQITKISAAIVVSRDSQKGMVVGKGGSKIKEIGQISRQSIEQLIGKKVYLDLQVRVEERWIDSKQAVHSLLDIQLP